MMRVVLHAAAAALALLSCAVPEAAAAAAVEWGYDGPCGDGRACDEDEIEAMEEDLAEVMQVSLLQHMKPDVRLADAQKVGGGAFFGGPVGLVVGTPATAADDLASESDALHEVL